MAWVTRAGSWRTVTSCLLVVAALAGTPAAAAYAGSGPSPGQGAPARNLVAARRAALDRAKAAVTAASEVLADLRTRAEVLAARYDQAVRDRQQAAAASRVAEDRLAAARRAQQASARRLAQEAAADFEAWGGQSPLALMVGDAAGPGNYLLAMGLQGVLADHRADLLAASQADGSVARLISLQAGELLASRSADLAAAESLTVAAQAAIRVQRATVEAAKSRRNRLAAELAQAKALMRRPGRSGRTRTASRRP